MAKLAHHVRIQFKWKTDNSVKFSCLLCLPKKNVLAFANLPLNLRKHVDVRTEYYYRIHSMPSCSILEDGMTSESHALH